MPEPAAAIAAMVVAQPLFFLIKAFLPRQSSHRTLRRSFHLLLQLFEAACSLSVAALTWRAYRNCDNLTRAALATALGATVLVVIAECAAAALVAHERYGRDYSYGHLPGLGVLCFLVNAPLLVPFAVAAARAWLRDRAQCAARNADAVVIIVFAACCTLIAVLVVYSRVDEIFSIAARGPSVWLNELSPAEAEQYEEGAEYCGSDDGPTWTEEENQDAEEDPYETEEVNNEIGQASYQDEESEGFSILSVVMIVIVAMMSMVPFIVFGLGMWAALDTSRDVLIDGLIVLLPPTVTMVLTTE